MGGMERKYKITAKTDAFIANKDITFSGKTYITLEDDLTLKEARKKLLDMYNEKYSNERGYCKNWGGQLLYSQGSMYIEQIQSETQDGSNMIQGFIEQKKWRNKYEIMDWKR